MAKRITVIVLALLILSVAAGLFIMRGKRFVVELTEGQIQEKLDARFPVEKSYLLIFVLTLSDPKVVLEEGADRLSFGLNATLNIKIGDEEKPLSGTGLVSTGIRYNPDDYSFYLTDPKIEQLAIQGIPIEYTDKVNEVAKKLALERINNYPVYQLKDDDIKQAAARLILQDLIVKEGKLVITLGL
ncbi:MAG: DUF1439 domain-containing protein [Phycisphaerae bacterium]|nr:DUF1439 domain-containing protein [Phycisphaerae bacterium]